ncbi:amino acid decarboxylase [Tetragenococcus muriaticus]|uniref:Prenylated flavin chaperone LpdD-like domain-containing protein n=1 Tax=Tetragenococcus muriaticus 3MR10-3 TaxID=1302648 RepID=A0A091BYZ1_9ENTE|nr:amino acid decarboxylase [Tetragenococcus muriaticus]KFN89899.1 hypothetical protein TMU3MR103_1764 [Tetragenococcus muriaticus 3MR10-3]GMA46498.1 hypothetical protein GCM10025854_07480 [Tetragenococcus muriaticus]
MSINFFQITQANFTMKLRVEVIGKDLLVSIMGGDSFHIGTTTTVTKNTAAQTIRFPSHEGRFHKDNVLAENIARIIQPNLPGNCVITAGVHINDIKKEQIDASFLMAEQLGKKLQNWLKEANFNIADPIYKK